MKNPALCQICLRTERDRELKVIDEKLSDFHDELCEFTLNVVYPKYCTECAYMLRKVYKFHAKCKNAIKVFKNWKKTKGNDKKPVELLYTLLPHTSLELWAPKNNSVYNIFYDGANPALNIHETNSTMGFSTDAELKGNILAYKDIKIEIDEYNLPDQNPLEGIPQGNDAEEIEKCVMLLNKDNIKQETQLEDFVVGIDDNEKKNFKNGKAIKDDPYHTKEPDGCTPIKKSLLELADITFSDDDLTFDTEAEPKPKRESEIDSDDTLTNESFVDDDSGTEYSITDTDVDDDAEKTERKIINKDNTKKLTLTMNRGITKSKNKRVSQFVTINGKRVNLKSLMPYTKERLKELLLDKFKDWGELKANDGTVIDKDVIMGSVDDRVPEATLVRLWSCLRRRKIGYHTLNLLKSIQMKHTLDLKHASVFEIEYLNTREKVLDEFQKRKTYKCYLEAKHKCDVCYQGFRHEKSLQAHHQKYHDKNAGEYVCSVCRVTHKQKKQLDHHMELHAAVYKCKLCPLITCDRLRARNHYDQHNGRQYECISCDVTYRSRSAFFNHKARAHHGVRHICSCGRAFGTQTALKLHRTYTKHEEYRPSADDVRCEECDLPFASRTAYLTHKRFTHHPYHSRKNPTDLDLGPCLWTCRECEVTYSSYISMVTHYKTTHPTVDISFLDAERSRFLCDICGKEFKGQSLLRDHMHRHTGVQKFKCDLCPKRFWSKLSLFNHRLFHYPPTKVCPHCGKKFHSNSNLGVHIRMHIGNRRFKCQICEKTFLHGSSLNAHIRGVHNQIRRVKKKVAGAKRKKIVDQTIL